MGDPNGTFLPPGCRFYPSEEELLHYYLPFKNNNKPLPLPLPLQLSSSAGLNSSFYDTIKEINLYNFNPFELPVFTCFRFGFRGRKRHWYCYTERVNSGEERKSRRKAGFGFWKMKGKGKDVIGNGGKVVLGRRKSFIFYMEKFHGKAAVRTDWVMYEYALISNLKRIDMERDCARGSHISDVKHQLKGSKERYLLRRSEFSRHEHLNFTQDSFVVCRVFVKPCGRNNVSEHALYSCGGESIATVRDIGIQHDGTTISALAEDKTPRFDYVNDKILGHSSNLIEETEPNNLVKSPEHVVISDLLVDSLTVQHLACIREGDYLELDDLV